MTLGLPLVHLHPSSVVELGWMSKMPALGRDRLSPTREGKLWLENLSTPPSRAEKGASGGKNPWIWMLLFSLLQVGASSSRTTPLKYIKKRKKKIGTSLIPQSLKRYVWSSVILTGHGTLWKIGNAGWSNGLNYNTVLQLDWFYRKQEKWVEVTYMLLFISLCDMPDMS